MHSRALRSLLALASIAALVFAVSCSDDSTSPDTGGNPPPQEFPNTYPPIPRPSTPDETIPDESEIQAVISPIAGKAIDFAPYWTDGVFTWDVDVQTQYDRILGGWQADAPGNYYNGTANSSILTFEGGGVDLRDPIPFGTEQGSPHSKRILFVEQGEELATPRNPERNEVLFNYIDGFYTYSDAHHEPALFGGYWAKALDPALNENERRRMYYVAAISCEPLEKPIYLKRERFWRRLPLSVNGNNLKSVRLDPGTSFTVTYTFTDGTSEEHTRTLTRTISGEVTLQTPNEVLAGKLGASLSEAFGSTVTISQETSVELSKTLTGKDGKTIIFSVWSSVERYSVVDVDGNPYEEPTFSFLELGITEIQGEYEWLSSTEFDYQ